MVVTVDGMFRSPERADRSSNAYCPMLSSPSLIVRLVTLEQPKKAESPTDFTPLPSVIALILFLLSLLLAFAKAFFPIVCTLSGIVNSPARDVQLWNALSSIVWTFVPSFRLVIPVP